MERIYAWEQACIGCRLCELACVVTQVGSLSPLTAYRSPVLPAPKLRVVEAPDGKFSFASTCHQCKEPLCLYSCLTGALYRDEQGMVRVEAARCVGCWTCVLACPYGAIRPGVEVSGNPYGDVFSSDSSSAGSGDTFRLLVSTKCDLCQGRRESPACVDACPNGALVLADHVPARWREVTQIVVEQLEPHQAGEVATTGGEGRKEAGNVA